MEIFKGIFGSKESAKPLIINVDTVYINSNVEEVERDFGDGRVFKDYKYDQIQMTKDEYIELIANKNEKLKEEVSNLLDLNLEKEETIEKLSTQMNNILEMLLETNEEETETNEEIEETGDDENEKEN